MSNYKVEVSPEELVEIVKGHRDDSLPYMFNKLLEDLATLPYSGATVHRIPNYEQILVGLRSLKRDGVINAETFGELYSEDPNLCRGLANVVKFCGNVRFPKNPFATEK